MSIVILSGDDQQQTLRGRRAWSSTRDAYEAALAPFIKDIPGPEPLNAIRVTSRTVTATLLHSTRTIASDDISWQRLANELTEMSVAYLLGRKP